MTAHHPKASMIGATTVTTPTVMPPPANRPEPAGMIALRAAIAEGRDPLAEFLRGVKSEKCAKRFSTPSATVAASLSAALAAYHAPRIAATTAKIIAAIRAGRNTRRAMIEEVGISDSQISVRLTAMVEAGVLHCRGPRPFLYSIAADNTAQAGMAAE